MRELNKFIMGTLLLSVGTACLLIFLNIIMTITMTLGDTQTKIIVLVFIMLFGIHHAITLIEQGLNIIIFNKSKRIKELRGI